MSKMYSRTQHQVACELDRPERIVRRVLQRQHFKDAGSLLEYLDDNEEELEAEELNAPPSPVPPKHEKPKLTVVIPPRNWHIVGKIEEKPPIKALTLRQETELLYKQSICLVCRKERRKYVLLPCSHLAVCDSCLFFTKRCPMKSCNEPIVDSVRTY